MRNKIPVIERFWKYVDLGHQAPCWEWIGAKCAGGYGKIKINKKWKHIK